MTKFSMVSARLEVELLTSQQRMREAFSKDEVAEAKEKKESLEKFSAVSCATLVLLYMTVFAWLHSVQSRLGNR